MTGGKTKHRMYGLRLRVRGAPRAVVDLAVKYQVPVESSPTSPVKSVTRNSLRVDIVSA